MTAQDFRRIALGMKDAVEGAHMGHPDFRVGGRIFATLHGDDLYGMVKLSPDQQREFIDRNRDAFAPEAGAWGRHGCTAVELARVDEEILGEAMTVAWQNTVHALKRKTSTTRKTAKPRSR
jgi:hypothetical protein